MVNDDMRKNCEGYSDPTVYNALKNIEKDGDERFHKLLDAIFTLFVSFPGSISKKESL